MNDKNHYTKNNLLIRMRFADIAKEENLTNADLANEIGCNRSYAVFLRRNVNYPSLPVMMKFIKDRQLNLSYMLCRTEISRPCTTYEPNNRLKEMRKRKKFPVDWLSSQCSITSQTLRAYENRRTELYGNIAQWIRFSEVYEVSIDYLLGLVDEEQWEDYGKSPIFKVEKGDAGYLKSANLESAFLLSHDGKWVYFPDGTKMESDSMEFRFAEVVRLEPEK